MLQFCNFSVAYQGIEYCTKDLLSVAFAAFSKLIILVEVFVSFTAVCLYDF